MSGQAAEDDKVVLKLRIELPRGVPVMAFVGLTEGLEAVIKAFVKAVDLNPDEVKLWVGGDDYWGKETEEGGDLEGDDPP